MGVVDCAPRKERGPPLSSDVTNSPQAQLSPPLWSCYPVYLLRGTHPTVLAVCGSSIDWENWRNQALFIQVSSELTELQAQHRLNQYLLKK